MLEIERRGFLKRCLCGGAAVFTAGPATPHPAAAKNASDLQPEPLDYRLTRQQPARLFDGKRSWVHARGGIVPGAGKDGLPAVVITMNTMHLGGSDVF